MRHTPVTVLTRPGALLLAFGISGLSDLSVGDVVEIEYEEIGNSDNRRALEIEADGPEDDD